MKKIINVLLINGPNLNLLGNREVEIYGNKNLSDLLIDLRKRAEKLNISLNHIQSNAEHILIEKIHDCKKIKLIIL